MRLTELEPKFLKVTVPNKEYAYVETIAEADGVDFLCPECFRRRGEARGVHGVICWRPAVPLTENIGPGRWELTGNNFEDLTLVAGSSSVKLTGGCNAHFLIANGEIQFCDDSGK